MTLVYLEESRFELLGAIAWYEENQEGLGARFAREVEAAEDEILRYPELWGRVGSGLRRKLLRHFPYGLVYRVTDGGVVQIVAVMHQHREPGYWLRRDG